MSSSLAGYVIRTNLDRQRYEAVVGDQVAGFLDFQLSEGQISLNHTQVGRDFSGRGLARRLVLNALFEARLCGLTVTPACPYVRRVIELTPDKHLDLVRVEDRERFELHTGLTALLDE